MGAALKRLQWKVDIDECIAVETGQTRPRADVPPVAYSGCLRSCTGTANWWKYFCGWHDECNTTKLGGFPLFPELAYARARRHVEDFYSVVGILERLEESVDQFESVLPRFFLGAAQALNKSGKKRVSNTPNAFYVRPNAVNT